MKIDKEKIRLKMDKEVFRHGESIRFKIKEYLSENKAPDILILKAHQLSEHYINQILIYKTICSAKEIDDLTFYSKCEKCFSLKNREEKNIFDQMTVLNKIRNRVGHELEYKLSEYDIDKLGYVIGKEYILDKYNYNKLNELLRSTLIKIVMNIGIHFSLLISNEKIFNEIKKDSVN